MSVNTTILTSPVRVKRDTALNDSVDDNLLFPAIVMAQERNVHPVLGTRLYDKVRELVADGTINDAGNAIYKTLLDTYVVPMLVQYAFAEVIPILRLRFINNSIVVMGSEQSAAASYEEVKPIINSAREVANWYKERLIEYLCYNNNLYPEYNAGTNEDVLPTSRNYTQGLNLEYSLRKDELRMIRGILGL